MKYAYSIVRSYHTTASGNLMIEFNMLVGIGLSLILLECQWNVDVGIKCFYLTHNGVRCFNA